MSAFGKRGGISGGRPAFGVAKPMKGGPSAPVTPGPELPAGGEQFPPIDDLTDSLDLSENNATPGAPGQLGAMDRLTARQNASGDAASSKTEGFEAAVHRIKEQVLPRLLERVDPEAAA